MSVEKLRGELHEAAREGLLNAHVTWGPEAANMTPDERAAAVSKLFAHSRERQAKRVALGSPVVRTSE